MKVVLYLLFFVILILYLLIALALIGNSVDAYQRGYRYPVLLMELIILPLFVLGSIVHVGIKTIKAKTIDKRSLFLLLKYFGLFIALFIILFIAAMIFNDISAPGARIR